MESPPELQYQTLLEKTGGVRYSFYATKMTDAVVQTLTLENQLRQALENDEFVLYY